MLDLGRSISSRAVAKVMTVVPISERGEKNSPKIPSNVAFDVASLNDADGVCESWIVVGTKNEGHTENMIADENCGFETRDATWKSISENEKSSIVSIGDLKLDSTDQQRHIYHDAECFSKLTNESVTTPQKLDTTIERKTIHVDDFRAPNIPDITREDDTDYGLKKIEKDRNVDTEGHEEEGIFEAQKTVHDNLKGCCDVPVDVLVKSTEQKGTEDISLNPSEDDVIKQIEQGCDRVEDKENYPEHISPNHITSGEECGDIKETRSEEEMFLQRMCDCGTAYFFPHRRIKCAARLMVSGVKDTLERGIESGASQYKGFMREAGHDGEIEDVR